MGSNQSRFWRKVKIRSNKVLGHRSLVTFFSSNFSSSSSACHNSIELCKNYIYIQRRRFKLQCRPGLKYFLFLKKIKPFFQSLSKETLSLGLKFQWPIGGSKRPLDKTSKSIYKDKSFYDPPKSSRYIFGPYII